MSAIVKFDKGNVSKVRYAMNKALAEVASKYGITLNMKNIRYDDNTFGVRIASETLAVASKKVIHDGPVTLGDRFKQNRSTYTVTATDNKGMFTYSVVSEKGKTYKVKPANLFKMERLPALVVKTKAVKTKAVKAPVVEATTEATTEA